MAEGGRETEAKFYVRDLNRIREQLEALGALLAQPRVLETNLRFDLPGARLRSQGQVLRLRQDTAARLTYKGASNRQHGVLSREEIEFEVGDFEKARRLLEALGYRKLVYYEKYRTTYESNKSLVMLDELPYGNFIEIEGESVEGIRMLARELYLDPDAAVTTSYHALFERACDALKLTFEDLSFENFVGIHVDPDDLRVRPGDN
jgi:adenylate cyclase class 2